MMDGRTDGQMDGRMDGRTDGRTHGWTDARTDGWMDGLEFERPAGRSAGRAGGRAAGRTDGWMVEEMVMLPCLSQTIAAVLTCLNCQLLFGLFLKISLKVPNFSVLWAARPFNDSSENRR